MFLSLNPQIIMMIINHIMSYSNKHQIIGWKYFAYWTKYNK